MAKMTHKNDKMNTEEDGGQFSESGKPNFSKNGENEKFVKFQPIFIKRFEDITKTQINFQIYLQTI